MAKEEKRARDRTSTTAQGETDFWSLRSATFNTLYQQLQMPAVKRIIRILSHVKEKESQDTVLLEQYNNELKQFVKAQAVAKDFVKFLQTLERQFKNISKGDLKSITETMPSLLNGLKLIWTISRHINHNDDKFESILAAISNEICQKVRDKIDIRTIFKKKRPEVAIRDIDSGIEVLEKWSEQYNKTKQGIESEGTVDRWNFSNIKPIFEKPKHIVKILKDLREACVIVQQFAAILNNDLKAVTGSSEMIDRVSDKVTE